MTVLDFRRNQLRPSNGEPGGSRAYHSRPARTCPAGEATCPSGETVWTGPRKKGSDHFRSDRPWAAVRRALGLHIGSFPRGSRSRAFGADWERPPGFCGTKRWKSQTTASIITRTFEPGWKGQVLEDTWPKSFTVSSRKFTDDPPDDPPPVTSATAPRVQDPPHPAQQLHAFATPLRVSASALSTASWSGPVAVEAPAAPKLLRRQRELVLLQHRQLHRHEAARSCVVSHDRLLPLSRMTCPSASRHSSTRGHAAP